MFRRLAGQTQAQSKRMPGPSGPSGPGSIAVDLLQHRIGRLFLLLNRRIYRL